jgi:hypothetical protein
VGATIQLYAAGTPATGGDYGLGATPLIAAPLPTTDNLGHFTITGTYTLPPTPSHFYIVSTGGSPGVGNPQNPNIVLMAVIGGCTATGTLSPSLLININEVTTAAAALALKPFIAPPAPGNVGAPAIGAPSTAYNALQNAFETAQNLVNISSGSVVAAANNWTTTDANGLLINTLGDILAYCVNSDPNTTLNCSTLSSYATPPSVFVAADTAQMAWYVAQNPTNNTSLLFGLIPPNPPFVSLTSAPADFTVSVATANTACQAPVALGTAASFEVLAGSTVSNTGGTVITGGDLGLSPGTAIAGFPPGTVTPPATMHIADSAAAQAKVDWTTAYGNNDAVGLPGATLLGAGDLSGLTLTPGLYQTTSVAQISTNMTLDAQGDVDAVFIFQIGSTLTTAAGTQVILANGAQAKNVYWLVGTSATLGTNSIFVGTIMADASITLGTGAILNGRALANSAAVTLDSNAVVAP